MKPTVTAYLFLLFVSARLTAEDWPCWRGPAGNGISGESVAPMRFSQSDNVAWRVEPPGAGHSSPIVWGSDLFLTAAEGGEEPGGEAARTVLRFDVRNGKLIWKREVLRSPQEGKHLKNSYASGTPATDGERVYAAFLGQGRAQVAAVGFDGEVKWLVSPCGFKSVHGFSTSPVLYRDLVIVNCDQDSEEAALYGLEKETGKVRWKAERRNGVRSYVTPLIIPVGPQLVISGSKIVAGYDPENGNERWTCDGPTEQCVASPVFGHGLVYITGGFPDRHLLAIRPDGQGDVTESHIAWRAEKGVAYVPSPLLVGDYFYVVQDETGVLSAYQADSGKLAWQERLGGQFSSSLVYAAGNIYASSEKGEVHVVRAGGSGFERVALNSMGEGLFASPAISNGRLYLRTTKALYAIESHASVPERPFAISAAPPVAVLSPPVSPEVAARIRVFDPPRRPADRRLEKPRDLNGYHPWTPITDPEAWKERARRVREQILVSAGLWPMPEPTPLDPVIHGSIDRGDYTVEKVWFQSYPRFYVTGSLYRPKSGAGGKRPAVLCPHGHWQNGRFFQCPEKEAKAQIEAKKEKGLAGATYPLQARCAQLARLGCVVFHYDMVGYADSTQLPHREGFRDAEAELRLQSFFGLQTYDSVRALDFLSGLPDVDPKRIGVTGASGGGTQTFILCGIDDRPAVAFPAVMVSTSMQGGCVCENASYLRVGTGNIEIAALTAPRPLGMTGANDWTIDIETKGLAELKALYAALGVPDRVVAKCFPTFEHNYNQVSREMMYGWMNRHLNLGAAEPIEERPFEPLTPAELSVFDAAHPRPANALDAPTLRRALTAISDRQMEALRPRDAGSLERFGKVVGTALRVMVGDELPEPPGAEGRKVGEAEARLGEETIRIEKLLLTRKNEGEEVPAVLARPEKPSGVLVVAVHSSGKSGVLAGKGGEFSPLAAALLSKGAMVLALDPFLTGEYQPAASSTVPSPPGPPEGAGVNRDYAGFTFGYNRSLLSQRVHDLLTAIAYARGRPEVKSVGLAGLDRAGPWALLAAAMAGKKLGRTAVELNGFRFQDVKETSDEMMFPGAVKYGGLPAFAALAAPSALWAIAPPPGMEIAREAYRVAGTESALKLSEERPEAEALAEWLGTP